MGDGTKENPFTREDVLRLIEENGGTAEGLDLSRKVFKVAIDLSSLDLRGIILEKAMFPVHFAGEKTSGARFNASRLWNAHLEKADLQHAHFEAAELTGAHLEEAILASSHLEGADLIGAHLEGADLSITHLEGADFGDAHLKGAFLWGAKFSSYTKLEGVDWGDYILGDEKDEKKVGEREEYLILWSVDNPYRRLKLWYTEYGIYNVAGEFFFREMTIRRKVLKWWPHPLPRAWSKFISLICGYGERPLRVIGWAASVVLGLAFIYFIVGSVWEWWAFWKSLYFSAASFTALGYGSWLEITNDWIKGIGAFESFIGVFTMALFLITFVRKMTR